MSDFYVTLPSHSSKTEFPNNKANSFKIRLPHPIHLEGSGWQVGLMSISLPDAQVPVEVGHADGTGLFQIWWVRLEGARNRKGTATFDINDLKQVFSNVDGIGFMKSMIAFFEQRRIYNDSGPKFGAKYVTSSGKKTYIQFKWEGEELLIDNKDTITTLDVTDRPGIYINLQLAQKMGWVLYREDTDVYQLGPNIQQEFYTTAIPTLTSLSDVHNDLGSPVFWTVFGGNVQLSIFCNWRFLNLNKAFESVVGASSRSLFVYSDVSVSGVVGNQVTDLLREVNYVRQGKGSQYFEPPHIQYKPIRKDVLDIIETEVSETAGNLVKFGDGNTIVTLHFKQT